jgi:hypothetical protein
MANNTTRIFFVFLGICYTVTANASCIAPSGIFVGAGGGAWIAKTPTSAATKGLESRSMILNFGNHTAEAIPAASFSMEGKVAIDPNGTPGTTSTILVKVIKGQIPQQKIVSVDSNSSTRDYFNSITCTGTLTLTGDQMMKEVGGILPFVKDRYIAEVWNYSVSMGGTRVVLNYADDDGYTKGYVIELNKQSRTIIFQTD